MWPGGYYLYTCGHTHKTCVRFNRIQTPKTFKRTMISIEQPQTYAMFRRKTVFVVVVVVFRFFLFFSFSLSLNVKQCEARIQHTRE